MPVAYASESPDSPSFYASFIGPITSFIRTGNPNKYRDSAEPMGEPDWPLYDSDGKQLYKVLNVTSPSNVSDGYTGSHAVEVGTNKRCAFWARIREENQW